MVTPVVKTSLKEELKAFTGKKRRFLLLRIADMDTDMAKKICNLSTSAYNYWCANSEFTEIYRRRDELSILYKQEAITLLRRENQLAAVLLEGKMLKRIEEEIDKKEYEFIRTNLAREVYSKLIADLDISPKALGLSWEQRISNIYSNIPSIVEGEARTLEEGHAEHEADSSEAEQSEDSHAVEAS